MSGKKGVDWYDESDRDKMNMLEACAKGMAGEVERYLINCGVDVEEEDDDGVTALQIAAAKGHRSLVELLLRKGAQVERANYAGMTPFLHACREGHQDVVTILANHGANIHVTTGLGMSAMALACAGRHMGVVRTLRGLNAAVNLPQSKGHQVAPSPFMVAFFQMDIEICGFLKKNDANVWHQIRWMNGLDANRMGETLKFPPILMSLNYSETTTTLLKKAPKNTKDIRSVIQSGNDQELDVWIREGRIPAAISDGVTPLMYAAVHGQLRVAEKLLEHPRLNATIDAQENVLGLSALMFAIVTGDNSMVQLLLRHGANPRLSSTTKEPFSAMDLAHFSGLGQETVLKLYRQYLRAGKDPGKLREAGKAEQGGKNQLIERKSSPSMGKLGGSGSSGSIGTGGTSQRRLRRVIESIGKNLMVLADDLSAGMGQQIIGGAGLGDSGGAPAPEIWPSARARFDAQADSAQLQAPARFVLAEHILRGDARGGRAAQAQHQQKLDARIVMARQTAISWISRGDTLRPIVFDDGPALKNVEEPLEIDGLYLAAQRNAEKLLKNFYPSSAKGTASLKRHQRRKTDPTIANIVQQEEEGAMARARANTAMRIAPLAPQHRTPRERPRPENYEQKSPSSVSRHKVLANHQGEKTVRKAPHRLGHHQRVASSGSVNGTQNGEGRGGKANGTNVPESPQQTVNNNAEAIFLGYSSSNNNSIHNSSNSPATSRPSLFRVQYHHQHQAVPASGSPAEQQQQQKLFYNKRKNSTGQQPNNTSNNNGMAMLTGNARHNTMPSMHHNPLLISSKTSTSLSQHKAKPLTKALVQQKVHEWGLAGEFEDCFVAEEVDELTFASLRETEVHEVLARHGRANEPELSYRFMELIDEIKKCTGCSELL